MKEELDLTDEELNRVNSIITGIQSELEKAIILIKSKQYDEAISAINSGISKSNCPLCKRELGILIADVKHNHTVCELDADTCEEEHSIILKKAEELKNDFVPITTKKKALKEKKESLIKQEEKTTQKTEPRTISFPPIIPPFLRGLHHDS